MNFFLRHHATKFSGSGKLHPNYTHETFFLSLCALLVLTPKRKYGPHVKHGPLNDYFQQTKRRCPVNAVQSLPSEDPSLNQAELDNEMEIDPPNEPSPVQTELQNVLDSIQDEEQDQQC